MNFRYDINGLRAIAVIAVVLFHFNPAWVPGGFAGVDVFFVISGFLMTGIIFRGLENDDFNLFKFYVARANRIIPALAVLCLVLLFFGWFYLTPLDYKALGKHVASSMGFLSNVIYWKESGYFDAASHEKWLLHTWSLSVEWQFYILYPIVLVALKKFLSLENLKRLIVIGTILGFFLSVIATMKWSNPAYYLLPTRAWEMMMGGVAFLYPWSLSEKNNKLTELIGLALILGSYAFVSSDTPWPGYFALIPVIGSYLMIVANRQSSVITNNRLFQCLGKWSYSIYLWHWPIVVFGYYFDVKMWTLYGLPLSVLLGFISFKLVESFKFKVFQIKPMYMMMVLGLISSYVWLSQGFDDRYPQLKAITKNIVMPHIGNGYCFYSFTDMDLNVDLEMATSCVLGNKEQEPKTLLFGDSYAGHLDPLLNQVFQDKGSSYLSVSTNWCYPSFEHGFEGPLSYIAYEQCLLNRDFLKRAIVERKYKNIIFAAGWDYLLLDDSKHLEDFMEVVNLAESLGINVLVIPTPHRYKNGINPVSYWSRLILFGQDETKVSELAVASEANAYLSSSLIEKRVMFLSQDDMYSPSGLFDFEGVKVPYTLDGGHISLLGSLNAYHHFSTSDTYVDVMKFLD